MSGTYAFRMVLSAVLVVFGLSEASVSKGRYFQISIKRTNNTPIYYIWVPDSIAQFKGVIAHHHGCGGDGDALTMSIDYTWHYLAEKQSCIYVCPMENQDCNTWAYVSSGSFTSLKQAVDTVAKRIGHSELSNVPYALWGFSGGADWVAFMTQAYTSQIAVAYPRSAWYTTDPTGPAIQGIPMLWEWGGPADYGGQCADLAQFQHGRSAGMPWACAIEQNSWHSSLTTRAFAISYLDAMLTRRLPASGSVSIPLDTTNMWYGCSTGVNQFSVYPVSSYTGNRAKCALLPNESFARYWRRAMAADFNQVNTNVYRDIDTTPPLAPVKLRAKTTVSNIYLEWDLLPDLESSVKNFRVYRNNTQVYDYCAAAGKAEIQPTGAGDNVTGLDTPAVAYKDVNVSNGSTYTYEVTTINRANLESPRSVPLVVTCGATPTLNAQAITNSGRRYKGLSFENHTFTVDEPSGAKWEFDVFALDGKEIMHVAGIGRESVSPPSNTLVGKSSFVVRLRTNDGIGINRAVWSGR